MGAERAVLAETWELALEMVEWGPALAEVAGLVQVCWRICGRYWEHFASNSAQIGAGRIGDLKTDWVRTVGT